MAAVNDARNVERQTKWYEPDVTLINEEFRALLEDYSKVNSEEVVDHVNKIRSRAFLANPYPCIGQYRFLNLTLLTHPLYPQILERLRSSPEAVYLDVGCCFGQDLRQLVYDGIDASKLTGLDIEGPLMEFGYDLFLDRDTLKSEFVVADIFAGGSQGQTWSLLTTRGADVVHCSAFFHLFSLADQKVAAEQIAQLVKVGGVIVGRQSGRVTPGDVPAVKAGTTSFRHNVESWRDLWNEVGDRTGTKWRVDGTLDTVGMRNNTVEDQDSRRLLFTVHRLE